MKRTAAELFQHDVAMELTRRIDGQYVVAMRAQKLCSQMVDRPVYPPHTSSVGACADHLIDLAREIIAFERGQLTSPSAETIKKLMDAKVEVSVRVPISVALRVANYEGGDSNGDARFTLTDTCADIVYDRLGIDENEAYDLCKALGI